mgnify:FL=1
MIKSAKPASVLKLFGAVGCLAVVLVGTSGCIRIVSHDTDGQEVAADSSQSAETSEDKMVYSITGVEVHNSSPYLHEGKVAVIRWHVVNNSTHDEYAIAGFSVYQNKIRLDPGVAEDVDRPDTPMLAPGGEFDGVSIYDLNDLSPIEIKLDDTTQTFNLE